MKSVMIVAFALLTAVGRPARADGRRLRDLFRKVSASVVIVRTMEKIPAPEGFVEARESRLAAVAEKMFHDFPPRHDLLRRWPGAGGERVRGEQLEIGWQLTDCRVDTPAYT